MKVQSLFLILLGVFPLISLEFLPGSLVGIFIFLLFLRIRTPLPQFIIYPVAIAIVFYIRNIFGNLIIPESTISFLATMCLAKFLAPTKGDYRVNRLLGFLWAGCFILFRTDLLSILFLSLMSLFLLKTFNLKDNEQLRLSHLLSLKQIQLRDFLLGLVVVILLFIFFPRLYHFLPGSRNQAKGKVGYSKDINNSSAAQLETSSQVAFYAQMKELPSEQLYWRGRVHSYTDGHNWRPLSIASGTSSYTKTQKTISYQIKYEQDFDGDLILLDLPLKINKSNLRTYQENEFKIFKSYNKKKKAYLSAISSLELDSLPFQKRTQKVYTQLPPHLTSALNPLLNKMSKYKTLPRIINEFRKYLIKEKFTYTLSPKNATTLKGFLENRQGFCTHYASLLGVTLRKLGFPTRLVSGFQGGLYNSVGKHYKVSSNDAHAWVEVFNKNHWQRVDPTSFVSPLRLMQGGEVFFAGATNYSQVQNPGTFFALYYNTRQYWENLNYKVSLFFDTFDRESQQNISQFFKLGRIPFVAVGLVLITIILIIFYFLFYEEKRSLSKIDLLFEKFQKILAKNKIYLKNTDGLKTIENKISNSELSNKNEFIEFIELYQKTKYSKDKNLLQLKACLEKLK